MINRLTIFNYLTAGGLLFTPCSTDSDPYFKMKCVWGQLHLCSACGCYWGILQSLHFNRFFPRTTNCAVIYAKHDRFLLTTMFSSGRHDIMLACHQIYLILICMRHNWSFYSYQVFRLFRISSSHRKPEIKEYFFVHVLFWMTALSKPCILPFSFDRWIFASAPRNIAIV